MTYQHLKSSHLSDWKEIEKIVDRLIENGDIQVTTSKDYIIGYLLQQIYELL